MRWEPYTDLDTPLIVGERNPYGVDPDFALYPSPDGSAGHNLCTKILDLPRAKYLRLFYRTNLCVGDWSAKAARSRAVLIASVPHCRLILLGRKVAEAFRLEDQPAFSVHYPWGKDKFPNRWTAILPHPSGLCREWNAVGAYERAREFIQSVYPYDLF